MKRGSQAVLLLSLVGWFLNPTVRAEDDPIKVELAAIRQQQEELKAEVAALRADIAAIKQMLEGQSSATNTAGTATLADLDKQIKALAADVKALRSGRDQQQPPPDTTIYDIAVANAPYRGPAEAPVTIVSFFDFQCPFCIRENATFKQLLEKYPNDVRVVIKHFPLPMHAKAKPVHAASILAQKQLGNDGFWKFYDLVVANPKAIEIADLRKHAESLGMDLAEFDATLADTQKIDLLVAEDLNEGKKCKVTGTPTIMINGLKIPPRARNMEYYEARIKEIKEGKKAPTAAQPGAEKPAEEKAAG
ncbi:MAG: hypothetical protein HJJLKODD_01111 [Phycisphaerae bacterium]|nr:hypothetical protein [Phycisphaerae bacterium]